MPGHSECGIGHHDLSVCNSVRPVKLQRGVSVQQRQGVHAGTGGGQYARLLANLQGP